MQFRTTLIAVFASLVVSARAQTPPAALVSDNESPAIMQALDRLRSAQAKSFAKDYDAAEREYRGLADQADAPASLRDAAREYIQQVRRQKAGQPPFDAAVGRTRMAAMPAPAVTLHVATTGDDAGSGTAEKPFRTLERARDEIRVRRKNGAINGAVVVLIHGGRYGIERTFTLTAEDSGTPAGPVVYRAADTTATPVFTGGIQLKGFVPVTDAEILKRLPEEARGKVMQLDLKSAGVARVPPVRLGGYASGHGFHSHPAAELFCNAQAMPIARWPNEGFARIADVKGQTRVTGYLGGGFKEGNLIYEGDRPLRWKDDPDIVLYGYWFWNWADSYERVAALDTDLRQFTLAAPYPQYGFRKGQPYYALNLLSEIDQPGEWYIDRRAMRLYFYPPTDPAKADIQLSVASFAFVDVAAASNVRLEGITWEHGSVDAVHIVDASQFVLAGCTIRHFAGNGVVMRGGTGNGILSCDIHSMGRGGVTVAGGDRKTLTPAGHFVENCHIHDLARIDHTYSPAIGLSGVGSRIAHNFLHDIRSSAINLGGNDHLVEYNEICRVVLESDDQGAVDMFGNPTYRGNTFRYNYFHHIGNWRDPGKAPECGQAGIRLDDAISGTLIQGNLFRRCAAGKLGFGGVQIHGGKDNILDNNVFIDCAAAVSFSPWDAKHWKEFTAKFLTRQDFDAALYTSRYPAVANLDQDLNINHLWRNLVVRCGETLRRNKNGARLAGNQVVAAADDFADAGRGVLRLSPSSAILQNTAFHPVPIDAIGLYADRLRPDPPTGLVETLRATP